jgi:hypothetical protein
VSARTEAAVWRGPGGDVVVVDVAWAATLYATGCEPEDLDRRPGVPSSPEAGVGLRRTWLLSPGSGAPVLSWGPAEVVAVVDLGSDGVIEAVVRSADRSRRLVRGDAVLARTPSAGCRTE